MVSDTLKNKDHSRGETWRADLNMGRSRLKGPEPVASALASLWQVIFFFLGFDKSI